MSTRVLQVFPDWGAKWPLWMGVGVHPDSLNIPEDLAERLRAWAFVWQTVLNPQKVNRWSDIEEGRRWIREGNRLVAELQRVVGDDIEVVGCFSDYDPDRREGGGDPVDVSPRSTLPS